MTSTVRFFYAISNCVKDLTGFDDTENKFLNLFCNFSVSSISRALKSLSSILPATPAFQTKIAAFNLKRDNQIAAVIPQPTPNQLEASTTDSQPLANQSQGKQKLNFSDDEDKESPPAKRAKSTTAPKQAMQTETHKQPKAVRVTRSKAESRPKRTAQARKILTNKK